MTDSLGQSQVIPYLKGLVQKGHSITVLSTEKSEIYSEKKDRIQALMSENKITWKSIIYTKSPPIISTLKDVNKLWQLTIKLNNLDKFDIVHCRSYISAIVGLKMKNKFKTKFVFDMRGFWADERVDGKIWNLKNPIFNLVYKFFKKKEIDFLENADSIISLTNNAKDKILNWENIQNQPLPINVIPCCVDVDRFNPKKVLVQKISELKKELGISEENFVLTYLGSIGTWYMLPEMLDFFKVLLISKPKAVFLFITAEDPVSIIDNAMLKGIPREKIIIQKADYTEVPNYLALSDFSLFFILPVFSKSASSPIKQGEIMSMGIPIICNAGVGDTDYVLNEYDCGFLVKQFNDDSYEKVVKQIDKVVWNKDVIRNAASDFYSLKQGINNYNDVYVKIMEL
ncbi:MAG: glycosyltransferase involved in cell wall biosynthesis [Planctomycetota bacterium]|jgi:glycosyltransferase involved in cell wall biosynthesis